MNDASKCESPPAPPDRQRSPGLPELPDLLGRFTSVVGHELRNPLSSVKIALQSLERQSTLSPKDSNRVRIALREVGNLERLLSEMLEWATPRPLDLQETTAGVIADLAANSAGAVFETHRLRLVIRGDLGLVLSADVPLAARALSELLRNAAQSSPEESEVLLEVSRDAGSRGADFRDDGAGDRVRFVVRDTGQGIAGDELEFVFEPYHSRRARGIGLGLPRARNIARLHGGDVRVEPQPEGGVRATLLLPMRRRDALRKAVPTKKTLD